MYRNPIAPYIPPRSKAPVDNGIALVPNPASDEVTIMGVPAADILAITITDTAGKLVYSGHSTRIVSLQELSAGLYIVTVKLVEGHIFLEKLIKN